MGRIALGLGLMAVVGCGRGRDEPLIEPLLGVWVGDADRRDSDFLAILDVKPGSPTAGRVLRTIPVGSRGNEPFAVLPALRDDRRFFATGLASSRTFVFDLAEPLEGRLVRVDEPGPERVLRSPTAVRSLSGGSVLVAYADPAGFRGEARETLSAVGGLAELDASGRFTREVPANDPTARGYINATSDVAITAAGVVVTTNRGHLLTAAPGTDFLPGITVQVWQGDKLKPRRTVVLEAGPRGDENLGPMSVIAFHRGRMVYVLTHEGGGLYASDSAGDEDPAFRMVADLGRGTAPAAAALTPDDHWLVVALAGSHRVGVFDVTDPWAPRLVSVVRLDRDPANPSSNRPGGPAALALSADGTRVAVADYGMQMPAFQREGDRRVYLLVLDPLTGQLRVDPSFRDELTGQIGIDFNRKRWPHGETGPARPHGLLFLAPAPPPDD